MSETPQEPGQRRRPVRLTVDLTDEELERLQQANPRLEEELGGHHHHDDVVEEPE